MKTLNIRTIVDGGLNIYFNDHIAIFDNFEQVRHHEVSSVLVEGFLFSLVTRGVAQLSVDEKAYQLKEGDILICHPRIIFEKSMMSMDFNAMMASFACSFTTSAIRIYPA